MSNAAFVLIAIAVIIVVSVLLWLLNRKPQTFMSSIDDFEREMKALGGETNKSAGGGSAGRQRRRAVSPSARRPDATEGGGQPTEPGASGPTESGASGPTESGASGPTESGASGADPRGES